MIEWTKIQYQRLLELGLLEEDLDRSFADEAERNRSYQQLEKNLVQQGKETLNAFREIGHRPPLVRLEQRLAAALIEKGFSQVMTPLLLSKGLLAKMTITENHPLFKQVFWVDAQKCLRPMLAPNLYYILRDLLRLWPHPVSIFEVGTCFRKDTQGGQHMQEFTMLNLVEMGLPLESRADRLRELAATVMEAAEIDSYAFAVESSEVYGETIDVVCDDLELGSGAMGPLDLDQQWAINVPWVGIGFGLERLVMIREGYGSVQRAGRSLAYLNGVRLNIK